MMARRYSERTLKKLFLMGGHYCAFPDCPHTIFERTQDDIIILGEIAYIRGSSDDGPRSDPKLSPSERDDYNNLLILCPHHHNLIDKNESDYPVEILHEWKRATEQATINKLSIGAREVTFAELQIVCSAYADNDIKASTPMIAFSPEEKMSANSLTEKIAPTMRIGLGQAPQVAEYIRRQAEISSKFPERLRAGFLKEYNRLLGDGFQGDELFNGLIEFGTNSSTTPQDDNDRYYIIRSAATAVLCHLFEVCDLFEAPA